MLLQETALLSSFGDDSLDGQVVLVRVLTCFRQLTFVSPTDRLTLGDLVLSLASNGPDLIALSHETALLLYGISDVNPSRVNLTVPVSARMRRVHPKWIAIHRANLAKGEIHIHEGMPVTTVERSILDTCGQSEDGDGPPGHRRRPP